MRLDFLLLNLTEVTSSQEFVAPGYFKVTVCLQRQYCFEIVFFESHTVFCAMLSYRDIMKENQRI